MDKEIVTLNDLLEDIGHHIQGLYTYYSARLDDLIHTRSAASSGLSSEELNGLRKLSFLVPPSYLQSECNALCEDLQQIRLDSIVTSITDHSIRDNVFGIVDGLQTYAKRLPTDGNLEDLGMMSGCEARLRKALLSFAREAVGYDHFTTLRTEYAFRIVALDRLTRYLLAQRESSVPLIDSMTTSFSSACNSARMPSAHFSSTDVTLAMIDFNDFKPLNDMVGHQQADVLIQQFGVLFKKLIDTIPTMVGARGYRAGDEFYFLMNGIDSDGVQGIVKERFIPEVADSDNLFRLVKEKMKRLGMHYTSKFEENYRFSVSIGVTSTHLGNYSALQRVSSYLPEDGPQRENRRLVQEGLARGLCQPEITRSIPEMALPDFVKTVYTMLLTEAERAMYYAKNNRPEQGQNAVFIYDPSLSPDTYRSGTRRRSREVVALSK